MSRYIVSVVSMVIFLAVMIMTFVAMAIPSWMIYITIPETPGQTGLRKTIGLYKSCSSIGLCHPFPQYEDCKVVNQNFCNTWRSIGFLMWIASITYVASFVGFTFVVLGDARKWKRGWKFLSISLMLGAAFECASISTMANLLENEEFFTGWRLGTSWIISTLSWIISVFLAAIIVVSEYIFEPEGDYELIPADVSYPRV